MNSSFLAASQAVQSPTTILGQTALQQQSSFFDRLEPVGSQDIETALWWRTMQNICGSSESILQQRNELVQEIAEWSSSMEDLFSNDPTTSPSVVLQGVLQQGSSTLDVMIEQNAQLEERNRRLRGILLLMFSLWEIAAHRQHSLLEESRKLAPRMLSSLVLQQMSLHHDRISQTLYDTDSSLPPSVVNDARSLEILTANLAHLTRLTDLSPSSSSSSHFANTPTQRLVATPSQPGFGRPSEIPDASDMAHRTREHYVSFPSGHSPSSPPREASALQEIPMPQFITSQTYESVEQDPGAVRLSL